MATYLRVQDGIAVEEWSEPDGISIKQCFAADVASMFKPKGLATIGWTWDGSKFNAPIVEPITASDLAAYAAAKRFSVETGGIAAEGYEVSTSRESQSLITGAYNYVQANPDVTVKFKTATGFVDLTAAQMTAIANAVGAHVQASFAAEQAVDVAITAGTIKTYADIDTAAWPLNS